MRPNPEKNLYCFLLKNRVGVILYEYRYYQAASHARTTKMRPIVTDVPWSVCLIDVKCKIRSNKNLKTLKNVKT